MKGVPKMRQQKRTGWRNLACRKELLILEVQTPLPRFQLPRPHLRLIPSLQALDKRMCCVFREGRCWATWQREFKVRRREVGPPPAASISLRNLIPARIYQKHSVGPPF